MEGPQGEAAIGLCSFARVAIAWGMVLAMGTSISCSRTGLRLLPTPRQIAPLSTSMVTSRRPLFRWTVTDSDAESELDICADRDCHILLTTVRTRDTQAVPPLDLPHGVVYWRVLASANDDLGTAKSAVWEVTIPPRSAAKDTSWGTVLDVDGDGLADAAVGAPKDGGGGNVYLYRGGLSGLSHPPLVLSAPDGPGGQFGTTVGSAGDVDGDGYGDLIVGAPCAPRTEDPDVCGPGRAYLYRGGPGGPETTPSSIMTGPDVFAGEFGEAVAGAGDVNGDGYADVLIQESQCTLPSTTCVLGRAFVYLGGAAGLETTSPTELAGIDDAIDVPPGTGGVWTESFAAGADVNGDGYADVFLSGSGPRSPDGSDVSQVYTFLGSPSGLSTTPAATLSGKGEDIGDEMASLGDVNGDGYPDFALWRGDCLVPVTGCSPARVSIQLGGPDGLVTEPSITITSPGGSESVLIPTGPGDIDGDGFDDLALFDIELSPTALSAQMHVYRGGASGLSPAAITVLGPLGSPDFSGGVLGVTSGVTGDVDGDGRFDLLVGSLTNNAAYLYRADASGLIGAPITLATPNGSEDFGYEVASRTRNEAEPGGIPRPAK